MDSAQLARVGCLSLPPIKVLHAWQAYKWVFIHNYFQLEEREPLVMFKNTRLKSETKVLHVVHAQFRMYPGQITIISFLKIISQWLWLLNSGATWTKDCVNTFGFILVWSGLMLTCSSALGFFSFKYKWKSCFHSVFSHCWDAVSLRYCKDHKAVNHFLLLHLL